MTYSQSTHSDQATAGLDLTGAQQDIAAAFAPDHAAAIEFGQRLRAAREARQLDLEACAHALRLPSRILRKLEQGAYEGSDSRVYLASYISKYAEHLGVDADAALAGLVQRKQQTEPPLIATGGISHSRFLFDRYRTAATYVVLTLVIAVPTVWFGVRSTLDRDLSHLAPLNAAPVAQQDAQAAPSSTRDVSSATVAANAAAPAAAPVAEQPLMASMAPFPSLGDSAVAAPPTAAPAAVPADGHSLSLDLSEASWVEVTQQDGERLEYGLLPAGTSKTWHSDQPLDIRIGNVSGARASIDGQAVALDDFRRANVAHFRMQVVDGKAGAADL